MTEKDLPELLRCYAAARLADSRARDEYQRVQIVIAARVIRHAPEEGMAFTGNEITDAALLTAAVQTDERVELARQRVHETDAAVTEARTAIEIAYLKLGYVPQLGR